MFARLFQRPCYNTLQSNHNRGCESPDFGKPWFCLNDTRCSSFSSFSGFWETKPCFVCRTQTRHFRRNPLFSAGDKTTVSQNHRFNKSDIILALPRFILPCKISFSLQRKMSVVRPFRVLSKDDIGLGKTGRFLSNSEVVGVGVFSPLSTLFACLKGYFRRGFNEDALEKTEPSISFGPEILKTLVLRLFRSKL